MIGKELGGKYEIIRQIGKGGMGSVYEANRLGTSKSRVAIKIIDGRSLVSGRASDADVIKLLHRHRREVRAMRTIWSEFVVQIYDSGIDDAAGFLYLVMEYLKGEDLQQLIDRIGPLRPGAALHIAAKALLALSAAHAEGIVHRDIKPSNIFIAQGEAGYRTVKLIDFGIAKIRAEVSHVLHTTDLTTTGGFLGSPLYMSPEQAQSSRDVDHRTDIWSLGATLYCALAGRAPFQHLQSFAQLIYAICTSPPPPIQNIAPWVPPDVADVVDGALRIRPAERYLSASHMLAVILDADLDIENKALWSYNKTMFKEALLAPLSDEQKAIVAPKPLPKPRIVVMPHSSAFEGIDEDTIRPVEDPKDTRRRYEELLRQMELNKKPKSSE